jgi:acetylornithine deacetylase/succinyl-diaminopimelate desuccinylase-like protein
VNALDRVHTQIDSNFSSHLEKAREFLRIPSVACQTVQLNLAADWLTGYMESIGATVNVVRGDHPPLLICRFHRSKPKTLLVYGMYDVQPADGQGWTSPPFDAALGIVDGEEAIIGRGACNSKGPLVGLLNAIASIVQADDLPLNILFLIEGEEESGSPALIDYVRANRSLLAADAALDPFWAEYGTDVDRPTLSLGTKGILAAEVKASSGEWGGPTKRPVHSSVGGWLASPTWRLIKAMATVVDKRERIRIPGFEDEIRIGAEDEQILHLLATKLTYEQVLSLTGSSRLKAGQRPLDLLRRYFFKPTVSIAFSSDQGPDVIPTCASAQLVFRLVPGMQPQVAIERLRSHLVHGGFGDIQTELLYAYPGARVSLHEDVVQSMILAYKFHNQEAQILPFSASATPYFLFSDVLGIPFVWGGLGRAGRSHAPDEFATTEGLRLFEKSLATFLYRFADSR